MAGVPERVESAWKAQEMFASARYEECVRELERMVHEAEGQSASAPRDPTNRPAEDDRLVKLEDLKRAARYNKQLVLFYQAGMVDPADMDKALLSLLPESLADSDDNNRDPTRLPDGQMSFIFAAAGAVPLYNAAVLAFNNLDMLGARRVLEFVFSRIESIDEWISLRICFLLLDVYFRLDDLAVGASADEILRGAKRVLEAAERILHVSSDRADGFGMLAPSLVQGQGPHLVLDLQSLPVDARFALMMGQTRLYARLNNQKGFRKEVKSAVVAGEDVTGKPTPAALFLKARKEKSSRKALRLIAGVVPTSDPRVWPLLLNNLGICYSRMGHNGLAATSFALALETLDDRPQSGCRRAEIAYNLGVQLLRLEKYNEAVDSLALALPEMGRLTPLVWLRLAEALVGVCSNRESTTTDRILNVVGSGTRRRVVVATPDTTAELAGSKEYMRWAFIFSKTALSMARKIAERLKPVSNLASSVEAVEPNSGSETGAESSRSADPLQSPKQVAIDALALLAYINLSLQQPRASLESALELLESTDVPQKTAFKAKMYAAEASCKLGRPEDALQYLNPVSITQNTPGGSEQDREVLFVNLGVTHAARGDLALARKSLMMALENSQRHSLERLSTLLLTAYLMIREGQTAQALSIFKRAKSYSEL